MQATYGKILSLDSQNTRHMSKPEGVSELILLLVLDLYYLVMHSLSHACSLVHSLSCGSVFTEDEIMCVHAS